jgi:three-Cys-motif partner protein
MEPVPEEAARRAASASIAHSRMSELPFKFDEIGIWSELKLEIIEQFGAAYTTAFARNPKLKKYYIDAFSGAGQHVAKKTKMQIEGSPARALKLHPPFDGYYFIDLDDKKTDFLRAACGNRPDVHIYTGDSNEHLIKTVLPKIQYKAFTRALCLLDPYGLHLNWEVIFQAGQSQAVDMFLNFPVMDMNRNAIWHDPEKVPQDGIDSEFASVADPPPFLPLPCLSRRRITLTI